MKLNRRKLLKTATLGANGVLMAPLLTQLAAHADGTTGATQRFVFVCKSSGLTPAEVTPESFADELVNEGKSIKSGDNYTTGRQLKPAEQLIDRPIVDAKLHATMKSLDPFRDRLTILQGLSGNMVNGGHTSGYGAMSCVKGNGGSNGPGTPMAETIDSIVSRVFPSVFDHLGLAVSGRIMGQSIADSVCYPGVSAAGVGKALPFQASPTMAYNSLFGAAASGTARAQFELSEKIYAAMAADVKTLMSRVAGPEREKLGFHLEAIEQMDKRRAMIARMGPALKKAAPPYDASFASLVPDDRLAAHFNIATGALIAGLTNAVTIRTDGLGTQYGGLSTNVHGIGHGATPDGFDSPDHARGKIRQLHLEQIAQMATALDKIPEGDGTMLDNTTIVYFSDVGDKHHASNTEWPFVILGNAGGRLRTGGRYVQYAAKGVEGHHTIANWWMTLLHAIGKPTDDFGQKDADVPGTAQRGPLAELIA